MLEVHLRAAGFGLLLLALLHAFFPKRFAWRTDLAGVSLLNRQIFYVHTLFIAVTVAFFGALSILVAGAIGSGGPLVAALLGGFSVFWALRLAVQLFVFDRRLWRGHRFETAIHVIFTASWTYLMVLYAWAWWSVVR